jgi:hypothetical protein
MMWSSWVDDVCADGFRFVAVVGCVGDLGYEFGVAVVADGVDGFG